MSVTVDLEQLAQTLADYTFAYLVTVGDDYRAHTVAIDPAFVDHAFFVGSVGGTTRRNINQHNVITLVWPPREPGGYTLIVDGTGHFSDDVLTVEPVRAVLHRKAQPGSVTKPGCKDDCIPLER
ncbi:MAG: hypothetical protein QOH60_4454 [Mycobacterium sp.]|jgi:hypothetical protein|nr:hypothetical protein [Mycobacterium sp.]